MNLATAISRSKKLLLTFLLLFIAGVYSQAQNYPIGKIYSFDILGDHIDSTFIIDISSGDVEILYEPIINGELIGGVFKNNRVYACSMTDEVYIVLPDGDAVYEASFGNLPNDMLIFDLVYDHINDILYAQGQNQTTYFLHIFSVDELWNLTELGATPYTYSGIANDKEGNFYMLDMTDNNFYSFDMTNFTRTIIGNIGFNMNWVIGVSCDMKSNIMYLSGYNQGTEEGVFGTIDLSDGHFTPINNAMGAVSNMAVLIQDTTVNINYIVEDLMIYPNPNTGKFSVRSENSKEFSVKVTDLNGKIILRKRNCRNQTQIDLSKYAKGIYIIKLMQDNQIRTGKIILK